MYPIAAEQLENSRVRSHYLSPQQAAAQFWVALSRDSNDAWTLIRRLLSLKLALTRLLLMTLASTS